MAGAPVPTRDYSEAVEAALGKLDLEAKARLLAGQDMWSLPALPEIGLGSLVMSDGPIGVRGVRWTAEDPSIALPSPTALAATWDPELARRAGTLLAQEARRKGVHVLLAPTVNLHRSPLGGRHFECYSEDPYLTGEIASGYVNGVQGGGVGTTVKHFVANDAETDRFTVDNVVAPRPLRELYLAPFEAIVENAHPWGIMSAYNQVNGTTMTEHRHLQNEVLRGEWGFDGFIVSDWMAARSTVGDILGGLDVAMPGPRTVYGDALAAAVRKGDVDESVVDDAVRNVLRLAARVGLQIESLGGTAYQLAHLVTGHPGRVVYRYGAMEFSGRYVSALATASLALTGLALCWLVLWRVRARRWTVAVPLDAALCAVLLFTVTSRVISPQYLVWLLGLAAVCLTSRQTSQRPVAQLLLPAAALSSLAFPCLYEDVIAGSVLGTTVMVARNTLLVAAALVSCRRLWASTVTASTTTVATTGRAEPRTP